ncbi:MAG: hypothetical protein CVU00_15215 [Bacteroidetes bacterium HGW-Bacteroidetes-17]|nr:MAG: hypothetical protein CVU00_15215 [Bacteroidetes bacterium HGW-Bacteroidetes-17]
MARKTDRKDRKSNRKQNNIIINSFSSDRQKVTNSPGTVNQDENQNGNAREDPGPRSCCMIMVKFINKY